MRNVGTFIDTFYVVTKVMLPMIGDIKFSKLNLITLACI